MLRPQQEQARKEPFGYTCRACCRCCPHKFIQVNPYEIARLARRLGLSTAVFRARYTERDGAILKRTEDDVCVFLTSGGCSVHPDRPLVCRLYPLGRRVAPDGTETWVRTTPHPQSEGEFTTEGTIADYIAVQGALPFMEAADEYADWVRAAYGLAEQLADRSDPGSDLLDMDSMISIHCADLGVKEPVDIEARRLLHLEILHAYLKGDPS